MKHTRPHVSPRSYLTAGIAVLGAGALALAPVVPTPERVAALPQRAVSDLGTAVLLSSFDPITPWVDTITTSIDNIVSLVGYAFSDPFPIGSAIVSDPGLALSNFTKLFTAPFSPGETGSFEVGTATPSPSELVYLAFDNSHLSETLNAGVGGFTNTFETNLFFLQATAGISSSPPCSDLGICTLPEEYGGLDLFTVNAVLRGINSYATGVVLGLLGPVLSPVAALINSVTATIDFLGEGDFIGALNELVNIPANLVNGFLNGATLNLTPIVNLFAPGILQPTAAGKGPLVGLNLGGLLTGPVPLNGSLVDPADPPTEFSGGTLFTSLAVEARVGGTTGVDFENPGLPTGPIGSLIGMGQFLGQQLLTPPEAPAGQTAAAFEAPAAQATVDVEAAAPAAVAPVAEVAEVAPAAQVVEVSEEADPKPATVSVTAARAEATADTSAESAAESANESAPQTQAGADEEAPAPSRAVRTAPAATAADTDAPAPRAAAASRR